MILTACTTGVQALYRRVEDPDATGVVPPGGVYGVPVEAWDDLGKPYVAGKNGLVAADTFRNARWAFVRLSGVLTWTGPKAREPDRFPVGDPDDTGDVPDPGGTP